MLCNQNNLLTSGPSDSLSSVIHHLVVIFFVGKPKVNTMRNHNHTNKKKITKFRCNQKSQGKTVGRFTNVPLDLKMKKNVTKLGPCNSTYIVNYVQSDQKKKNKIWRTH